MHRLQYACNPVDAVYCVGDDDTVRRYGFGNRGLHVIIRLIDQHIVVLPHLLLPLLRRYRIGPVVLLILRIAQPECAVRIGWPGAQRITQGIVPGAVVVSG